MAWIAAALVSIFLLWKYPKVTLITSAVSIVLALIGWGIMIGLDKQDRDKRAAVLAKIKITAKHVTAGCPPDMPMMISFENSNDFTVNAVDFTLSAKEPGRSTTIYSSYISSDFIMNPKTGQSACWSLANYQLKNGLIDGKQPSSLIWATEAHTFR